MRDTSLAVCTLAAALAIPAGAQTQVDLRNQGRNVDFSAATSTKPFRMGTTLPVTCSVGETFFKTDAMAGQNLYACTVTNVWTLQSGASGLPIVQGNPDTVLTTNGANVAWSPLAGDVTGAAGAITVTGLQGRPIGALVPADGQVLQWNEANADWEPAVPVTAGGANFSQPFTSQTSVEIPGSAHGLGTANLIVDCYNAATPAERIETNSISVHPATFDVTVTFAGEQSGRCVINGSGAALAARTNANNVFGAGTSQTIQGSLIATGSERTAPAQAGTTPPATCTTGDQFFRINAPPGQNLYFCTAANTWTQMSGGAAQVASVFGRIGSITPQVGDYNFSQIAGTLAAAQLGSGVDAAKIGSGAVTNTIWGYLANLGSDVQTQLNAKAPTTHTHVAGGDVSGSIAATTVTGIQSRAVSNTAPENGQALVWDAAGNSWRPASVAGSGGASMGSQLGDFSVTRASAYNLTIGPNCTTTTPCSARFGGTVYSFTRSCTASVTSGSGTAYIYLTNGGLITIGHNFSVSATTGCLAQSGVTAFPPDAIPLYSWTAVAGAWDTDGGRDFRTWLGTAGVVPGTGVVTADGGGFTSVGVDPAVVPTYLSGAAPLNFPSIANGACAADQSFTLTGAVAGDSVAAGWPATFEPGLVGVMRVSAADTITVRVCNFSGAAVDPINATYRATIVRSF